MRGVDAVLLGREVLSVKDGQSHSSAAGTTVVAVAMRPKSGHHRGGLMSKVIVVGREEHLGPFAVGQTGTAIIAKGRAETPVAGRPTQALSGRVTQEKPIRIG